MRLLLLFLFLAYPLLEIAVMIKVGGLIGVWPMLGIVLGTIVIGTMALRQHGFTLLQRMAEEMAAGRPPVAAMLEGALVATAGLMLISPGLITDAIGLALLISPLRQWIARHFAGKVLFEGATFETSRRPGEDDPAARRQDDDREAGTTDAFGRPKGEARGSRTPIVIDGEYERLDEKTIDPKKDGDVKKDGGPKMDGRPPRTPAND